MRRGAFTSFGDTGNNIEERKRRTREMTREMKEKAPTFTRASRIQRRVT